MLHSIVFIGVCSPQQKNRNKLPTAYNKKSSGNIAIQMKRKELTETYLMISNWICFLLVYTNYSRAFLL